MPPLSNFVQHLSGEHQTLHKLHSSISIGEGPLCNHTHDIDLTGGSEAELHDLTTRLERTRGAHGMELTLEKAKSL